jgi:Zn-dependent metalloprotease
VHINAGIPNRAFYLVALALGGYAWEKAGRIWYETVLDKQLKSNAQFRDFARLTYANAQRLYGERSAEAKAVKQGWEKVGVKLAGK